MPVDQFLPTVNPDGNLSVKVKFNILKQSYGDNYTARAPLGINNAPREYPLKWTALTNAEATYIIDFIEAKKGAIAFSYIPIGENSLRYFVCEEYSYKLRNGRQFDIDAVFIETAGIV